MKTLGKIAAVCAFVLIVAGCAGGNAAAEKDAKTAQSQLAQFQQSQSVPQLNYSQLRQNLIEIETAQATATATHSFMFLMAGAGASGPLLHDCPSIGFPIPATYQLTAPEGPVYADHGNFTLPQIEANGVYTGSTTGTYVMCIGSDGKPFAFYWEGFVATVTGPAHWDNVKGEIVMDGSSSAPFTGKK